jgi:hypothetical protein
MAVRRVKPVGTSVATEGDHFLFASLECEDASGLCPGRASSGALFGNTK